MSNDNTASGYPHPPIEEALVDFHFLPGPEWDLTLPGKLHGHPAIRDAYPGKPRQQLIYGAALQPRVQQPHSVEMRPSLGRVQLVNADGTRLVTLAPDALSVNVLRPYDGWLAFRPRVETTLRAYWEVAAPEAVMRIGVRYINRIVIADPSASAHTYSHCAPPPVPGLPERTDEFTSRVVYGYEDGVKLILTQATLAPQDGVRALLIDLDMVWEAAAPEAGLTLDEVMGTVDRLHEREGLAFEATITAEAREVFHAG